MLNLLLRPGWLDYDNLQVFGLSLFQPEYKILKKALEEKLPKQAIIGLFGLQDEIMRQNISPTLKSSAENQVVLTERMLFSRKRQKYLCTAKLYIQVASKLSINSSGESAFFSHNVAYVIFVVYLNFLSTLEL